jgi:hypothetical protein
MRRTGHCWDCHFCRNGPKSNALGDAGRGRPPPCLTDCESRRSGVIFVALVDELFGESRRAFGPVGGSALDLGALMKPVLPFLMGHWSSGKAPFASRPSMDLRGEPSTIPTASSVLRLGLCLLPALLETRRTPPRCSRVASDRPRPIRAFSSVGRSADRLDGSSPMGVPRIAMSLIALGVMSGLIITSVLLPAIPAATATLGTEGRGGTVRPTRS